MGNSCCVGREHGAEAIPLAGPAAVVDEALMGEALVLTVTSMGGEFTTIAGLHPGSRLAELFQKVLQASGLGACVHSLEVIGSLTCGTCQLEEPQKTLGDLGIDGQTLLTFVQTQKLLNIRVKDDEVVQASCEVACMSGKIRAAVEEHGPAEEIHLGEIKRSVFSKVMQYCVHHQSLPAMDVGGWSRSRDLHECGVSQWDCDLLAMEQDILFEIILAANHLEIQGLLDLCVFVCEHAWVNVGLGLQLCGWQYRLLRAVRELTVMHGNLPRGSYLHWLTGMVLDSASYRDHRDVSVQCDIGTW